MLRMNAPSSQGFLGLEFDDGDSLAVLGDEALVGDVPGHLFR